MSEQRDYPQDAYPQRAIDQCAERQTGVLRHGDTLMGSNGGVDWVAMQLMLKSWKTCDHPAAMSLNPATPVPAMVVITPAVVTLLTR